MKNWSVSVYGHALINGVGLSAIVGGEFVGIERLTRAKCTHKTFKREQGASKRLWISVLTQQRAQNLRKNVHELLLISFRQRIEANRIELL